MTGALEPMIFIIFIFVVYYIAGNLDMLSVTKKSKLDLDKLTAETRHEEARIQSKQLDVEMGRLALEAKKLDRLEYNPKEAIEPEFKEVNDDKD